MLSKLKNNLVTGKVEASLVHSSTNQYNRNAYSPWGPGNGWTDFNNASSFTPFELVPMVLPTRYNSCCPLLSLTKEKHIILDN